MRVKTFLIGVAFLGLCGCNLLAGNQKELQAFRQDVSRLKITCAQLTKQVEELTKLNADLKEQVALLQEVRTAIAAKPQAPSGSAPAVSRDTASPGEPKPTPGLCDIIETHIAGVEGILSEPDVDSAETLMDDLQAAFEANLKAFSQHPRIQQIRAAAAQMRSEYLAAAKQTPLATNPYLKNVRQKSLNDARKAARTLRALCEE